MVAQCCTTQIFAFEWGLPLCNALSLSNLGEYHHILPKSIFFGLHFCRREDGSDLTILIVM